MALRPVELAPLAGFQRVFLVELRGSGSAFYLALESGRGFQVWELAADFNFVNPEGYDFAVGDLTGDGIREIAIFPTTGQADQELSLPKVFSLADLPPTRLDYRPTEGLDLGLDLEQRWTIRPNGLGYNDLVFQTRVFPACPVEVTETFRWDGEWLETVDTQYNLTARQDLLDFCGPNLDHAISVWGLDAVLQLMEPDLAAQAADPVSPYPAAGLKDKWRLRLGIYHALSGDYEGAVQILQALIADPNDEAAGWSDLAESFLNRYQDQGDLYLACEVTDLCDLHAAVKQRVEIYPNQPLRAGHRSAGQGGHPGAGVRLF